MAVVWIENENIRVGVDPAYGARVTNLVNKATGRDWMTQGGQSTNTGEDTVYAGDEAVGWDECFPTVSPWDATSTAWGRRLRDHGDVWGRPWQVEEQSGIALSLSYTSDQFLFVRTLRVDGATLVADYEVENLSGQPLPYLWALHALLAIKPKDRMLLPGVDKVSATYVSLGGKMVSLPELPWSERSEQLLFPLEEVQPPSANFAGKFYAGGFAGRTARVGQPGDWLSIGCDANVDHLGIWLTYGAWPAPGGHYEAAIEPTNAPADHIGQVIDSGVPPLAPGEIRAWTITLSTSSESS